MEQFLEQIYNLKTIHIQILLTVFVVIIIFIARGFARKIIVRHVKQHEYTLTRKAYTMKVFNFIIALIGLLFLSIIWELSIKGLSFYFISFFTLVGVAFFANWSVLSNITASLILFFNYPFKIGDEICIFEGDKSISGKVVDISLFNIKLIDEDNSIVAYPNNLALQRPIIKKVANAKKSMDE